MLLSNITLSDFITSIQTHTYSDLKPTYIMVKIKHNISVKRKEKEINNTWSLEMYAM